MLYGHRTHAPRHDTTHDNDEKDQQYQDRKHSFHTPTPPSSSSERPTHHPSLNKGSYKTNQPPSIVQANAHQPHPDSFINIPITLKMPSKRKQPPNKEKKSKNGKRNQKKKIDAAASFFSVQAKAKVRQIDNHASLCKKFAAMHFTARARFNASLRI
jgi:hypothetical protein